MTASSTGGVGILNERTKMSTLVRMSGGRDYDEVFYFADEKGISIEIIHEEAYRQLIVKEYLAGQGSLDLLNGTQILTEAVLPKGVPPDVHAATVKDYLEELQPNESVVITDPYILQDNGDKSHLKRLLEILKNVVPNVGLISLVVDPKRRNPSFEQEVKKELTLLNSNLKFSIVDSGEFHDRFWIVDRTKGLILGTSLNGLGKRISLLAFLDGADVADIVSLLDAKTLAYL